MKLTDLFKFKLFERKDVADLAVVNENFQAAESEIDKRLLKTAVQNTNTVTEAGYALDARQANPNVKGSLGDQIKSYAQEISDTKQLLKDEEEKRKNSETELRAQIADGKTVSSASFLTLISSVCSYEDGALLIKDGICYMSLQFKVKNIAAVTPTNLFSVKYKPYTISHTAGAVITSNNDSYVVFVAVQDNGICQIYSPKRIDSSTENRLRFSMSFPYVLEEGIEAVG